MTTKGIIMNYEVIELAARASLAAYDGATGFLEHAAVLTNSRLPNIEGYALPMNLAWANPVVIVSIRGTDDVRDWKQNLNMGWADDPHGWLHRGFANAADAIWPACQAFLDEHRGSTVIFCGHSLGAAVSTILASYAIRVTNFGPTFGWDSWLITFGSPRVGNRTWTTWMDAQLQGRAFRIVNNNDAVPRMPTRLRGFRHLSRNICYFGETGELTYNPSLWKRCVEGVKGVLYDIGTPGLDAVTDHDMQTYYERVKNSFGV